MSGNGESDAAAQFARLRLAFHHCIELAPAERAQALAGYAAADAGLARELLALLAEPPAATILTAPLPPAIAGFLLIEEIGSGGMGVVWRAEREVAGFRQTVALKLLRPGQHSAAAHARFLREWRVLARLEHPVIARLIDAGVDGERPWLAMEFVDGPSYALTIAARPLPERVAVLAEVCDAVAYAHGRLVLHRDLKPANLRFAADGRVRLLDFGIARLLDDTDPELTLSGLPAGTPRYAAPEQWRGEVVGTAADVYALGRLLAEVHGGDPLLAAVAARASAAAPQQRYPSATALAEDLRDWLAGRALRSGAGSRRSRLQRWLWQHRWPLATVAAVVLTLAIGLWMTWQQAERARQAGQQARAHLDALLEVIGAASPEVYAGHDPPASVFLAEAARRLQALPDSDPELAWQSLVQIGQGLLNLGQPAAAGPVLEAALAAAERWSQPGQATRRLVTLRLLVLTQDGAADPAGLERSTDRIVTAAAHPDAAVGEALSALATAAAAWSRAGEFARSRSLLKLAQPWLKRPGATPPQLENYWRQRGWSALRGEDLRAAAADILQSLAVIRAHPTQFSALRTAEAYWLLAEIALQAGDAARATTAMAQAAPAFAAEYPQTHPERGTLALMQARAALLGANPDAAGARLAEARQAWVARVPSPAESRHLTAVTLWLQAVRGDCEAARRTLADSAKLPQVSSPVAHAALTRQAQSAVALACPTASAAP